MNDEDDADFEVSAQERAALEQALMRFAPQGAGASSGSGLERLRLDVEREIANEHGFTSFLRSRSTPLRIAIAAATLLAMALLTGRHPRADHAVYPQLRMALAIGSMAILYVLTIARVLWPLHRPGPPRWLGGALPLAGMFALAVLYSLPAAHLAHPASFVHGSGLLAQLRRSVPCAVWGLFFAAQVYAMLAALDRGGSARRFSFAFATGVAANLMLQLTCPVTTPEHLFISHLGLLMLLLFAIVPLRRGRA